MYMLYTLIGEGQMSNTFFMPPSFKECRRALSVVHVHACVRASVRPSVHHLSGYFVSATPPTILAQSF